MLRCRLLQTHCTHAPALVVAVAPAGYGKTVFARQLSELDMFKSVLWVELGGGSATQQDLLSAILRTATGERRIGSTPMAAFINLPTVPELIASFQDYLSRFAGEPLCLVIDSVGSGCGFRDIWDLAQTVRRATHPDSALVVTTRDTTGWGCLPFGGDVMMVDRSDLTLDVLEADEILATYAGNSSDAHANTQTLLSTSRGQVSLFCLLARHPRALTGASDTKRNLPTGLMKCIQSLAVNTLSPTRRRLLLLVTIMGRGSVSDLTCVRGFGASVRSDLLELAEALPLLRIEVDEAGREIFSVHDLAFDSLITPESTAMLADDWAEIVLAAQALMFTPGASTRMFETLLRLGNMDDLARHLERVGHHVLARGEYIALRGYLDRLPARSFVDNPRLLILDAAVLRQTQRLDDALQKVEVALDLIQALDEPTLQRDALLMKARVNHDLARYECVVEALASLDMASLDDEALCMVHGYYVGCLAQLGQAELADQHIRAAVPFVDNARVSADARAFTSSCIAYAQIYLLNDVKSAARTMHKAITLPGLPFGWSVQMRGNLGVLECESARLARSSALLEQVVLECSERGMSVLRWSYAGSLAADYAGMGDYERANALVEEAIAGSLSLHDEFAAWSHVMLRSAWQRAAGNLDGALRDAEEAYENLGTRGVALVAHLSHLEALACRLAQGDSALVEDELATMGVAAKETRSRFLLLRVDMILAEIERRRDECDAAVARIAEHADYILTEGSNWQIAMYIRAFPGLLGVFAKALSADRLPAHMLRMILDDDARRALMFARELLSNAEYERLAERVLGKKRGREFIAQTSAPVPLKVKVFGGLSVETPWGFVTDKAWCKRKSRLLFAMMVVSRGKDIARDVLFEHMWAGLPLERAQSNFYVIWSHMRKALAPGVKTECPYVEHRAGVCRIIPDLVTTDLDEFYSACEVMRSANAASDTAAVIAAAERILSVYQGELLPGDLYDDWFTTMRDALRHEFSDAMLMAANSAGEAGSADVAIRFARAGLAQDWWREDLYQAALRYQIMAGQRSSAIETYLTCRSRLSEDLGLDPSVETQRLYEQILAMETRESPEAI
ncbi:MAG: BTAD domain-containing putative transcriptional regulator [Coriobacteriia bacterium]